MYAVTHDPVACRFEVKTDGLIAELTYQIEGERILMLHTGVPPELEGRGIGSALAAAAVAYAQEQSLTVVPLCSFVRHWLDKHHRRFGGP